MLFRIIITASILIIGFRVMYLLKTKLYIPRQVRRHIDYLLPLFEVVVWLGFVIWIVRFIHETTNYYVLVAIGIMILLFIGPIFILMRDFLYGVFLKAQNKIPEGSFVALHQVEGTIIKSGNFRLDIEDHLGKVHSIAYGQIQSPIVTRSKEQGLVKFTLTFNMPKTSHLNELTDRLKQLILCTPWTATAYTPTLDNVEENGQHIIINMGVYSWNESYAENIYHSVMENLSAHSLNSKS